MKKRGMENSVFVIVLGVVALLVISTVLFGKLLPKTKEEVNAFEKGKLPGDGSQTSTSSGGIPSEVLGHFDNLVSTIKKTENLNGLQCLVPLNEYPKSKDDYFVSMAAGSISIKIKNGGEYGQTGEIESISGFNPCIVARDGAVNFYNNWLDGSIPSTLASPEYFDNVDANSLILFQSANNLKTPKEGGGREYELVDENGKRYLYKPDKSHFCLIHAKNGDCNSLKGDNKAIGKDCFAAILEIIKICGEPDKPAFMKDLINNGYTKDFRDAAIAFNSAVVQAVNSDKEICKVEFSRYPGFDGQWVNMLKTNDGNLQINAAGEDKGSVALQTVPGYQPCIVHGKAFYEWLWNGESRTQYITKDDYVVIKKESGGGVEFSPKDEQNKVKRDLAGGKPLIYKAGNGHVCMMHAYKDGSAFSPNNHCNKDMTKRNGVDDDCIYDRDSKGLKDVPVC